MTFQLDTSGQVAALSFRGSDLDPGCWMWSDLTPFAQGYIEALPWGDMAQASKGHRKWANRTAPGFSDLAPETLDRIIADCAIAEDRMGKGAEWGRYFWAARQAGLYGGDPKAKAPPLTVELGDDGKVRFYEEQDNV